MKQVPDRPEPPEEIQLPDNIVACHNFGCSGYKDIDGRRVETVLQMIGLDLCTCDDEEEE